MGTHRRRRALLAEEEPDVHRARRRQPVLPHTAGASFAQMTRDHSLINDYLMAMPDLTEEAEERAAEEMCITRAPRHAGPGDGRSAVGRSAGRRHLLACSDGLSGMIADDEILDILMSTGDIIEGCRRLIARANEHGGERQQSPLFWFASTRVRLPSRRAIQHDRRRDDGSRHTALGHHEQSAPGRYTAGRCGDRGPCRAGHRERIPRCRLGRLRRGATRPPRRAAEKGQLARAAVAGRSGARVVLARRSGRRYFFFRPSGAGWLRLTSGRIEITTTP